MKIISTSRILIYISTLTWLLLHVVPSVHAQTVLPLPTGISGYGGVHVQAIAVQPDGKVVIGGFFTAVNGISRMNIARLNADGSVDLEWNPVVNDRVHALAIGSDNVVYAGGQFDSVGGQIRRRIAAIDGVSGAPLAWNPDADNDVDAMAISGGVLYVGGKFGFIGGHGRSEIAALDVSTGLATGWNPVADNYVSAIAVSGGSVYVGGDFTSIGGQLRSHLAAVDVATGMASAWVPVDIAGGLGVNSLSVSGNSIYFGGNFTSVGALPRKCYAAIDISSWMVTEWNPGATGCNNILYSASLALSGVVYIAGDFYQVGGQSRQTVVAVDAATGAVTDWAPSISGYGAALAISGSTLYVGSTLGRGIAAVTIDDSKPIFLDGFDDR